MEEERKPLENRNFIDAFIEEDLAPGGRFEGKRVHTRFPPEPNGYLHIGHCKALTIDFGTAEKFGGLCNLRMDDTNPTKEDTEYVDAIQQDIHWLGFDWGDRFFYGSDYFEKDYEFAVELIKKGLAYVCDLTPEQFREFRGDIGKPAVSPYRDRSVEENLDLFERMKNGEFPEGSRTLRAKIDLASGNFNMRDPVIYRIRYMHHHRQGDKWCIYPMYDFAHPIQDALEGITHSLCSLEFEAHRPLYDWVVNNVSVPAAPVFQEDYDLIPVTGDVPAGAELAVRIQGDSMAPWIADGSVVYVNHDPLQSGDVGIFCVDGDMLCKQYYRDPLGMVYLFSLNRRCADMDVVFHRGSGRSLTCFGRVMMHGLPLPE